MTFWQSTLSAFYGCYFTSRKLKEKRINFIPTLDAWDDSLCAAAATTTTKKTSKPIRFNGVAGTAHQHCMIWFYIIHLYCERRLLLWIFSLEKLFRKMAFHEFL